MPLLSIKVDRVAFLRDAGQSTEPDPAQIAVLAEMGGAGGITCHLREDRLHSRDRDLYVLKEIVKTELDLQIAPVEDLLKRAFEIKPDLVTLVPFDTDDPFANAGIDLENNREKYSNAATALREEGIRVAYFVNPMDSDIKEAARSRVSVVEINATDYTDAGSQKDIENEIQRLEQMAQLAIKLGLSPRCGGRLTYRNIVPLAKLSVFEGYTVGAAVANKAILTGYERAVREMVNIAIRVTID